LPGEKREAQVQDLMHYPDEKRHVRNGPLSKAPRLVLVQNDLFRYPGKLRYAMPYSDKACSTHWRLSTFPGSSFFSFSNLT
jgi:hypothetical protein